MTKQINWVSLARKIIDKQNPKVASDAKTVRYIQSYIDTLLDKLKLTEAQSQGLIRNIDIHLGIAVPSQIVEISRKTAWAWNKRLADANPANPAKVSATDVDSLWLALLSHYGSAEAVAHAAVTLVERELQAASTQDTLAPQNAAQTLLNRNQQVTVSIWDATGSGNLDYKDGSKEHIVFQSKFVDARKKLEEAGAPESLWHSLSTALDGLDSHDVQYGLIHGGKDPKGKKAVSNPDCIIIKATPHGRPDKQSVTFVQSAYPITALAGTDGWKKRKNSHPDIKGYIAGLAA